MLKTIRKLLEARAIIMLMERFFRLGAGAVVTFMVARMLGDEALGVYGVVMVWAAFLTPLSSMGLNNLVQKMASSQTDPLRARTILQSALWLRLIAGLFFAVLMILGFAVFYPHYFAIGPAAISALFILQSFSAMMLCEYDQNYRGHFRAVALSKVVVSILTLTARVVALIFGANVDTLLLVVGIEFLLTGALQYYWHRRYAPQEPGLSLKYFSWQSSKELLKRSSWLWLSGVVSVIYLKIDTIMIEQMIGIAATGQYTAVARLSELWYVIPVTLAARYYPDLLKAYNKNWESYLCILKKRSVQFFLMAFGIAIFMTLGAKWIMWLAYGEKFVPSATVLQIHVWAGCFIFVRALISQHLIITGNEPLSLLSHGVGAILNVLLNLWLIPIYGIEGAAWATLISYAYASFFFLFCSGKTRAHFWQLLKVKAVAPQPPVKPES
ncbi:flippase [Rheinheimera sp.]|uniref:flippase n=1 Tax=Rheinheimera sp. TaxID=1869214 RepID=UPI0027BA4DE0|nr:flippase [Rheinheimera sp.]